MARTATVILSALALGVALPSMAAAVENLERIESVVFEHPGDKAELAGRAKNCMNQIVHAPDKGDAVTSADIANGTVTASNQFRFTDKTMMISSPQQARSTMTFEARENRFRFVYTDFSVFYTAWQPVAMRNAKSDDQIAKSLEDLSQKVAACIRIKPAKTTDW